MLRRRRETKKLLRIARMLSELDAAGSARPKPRRAVRVVVSART